MVLSIFSLGISIFVALLTFFVGHFEKVGMVRSSCLVSLLFILLIKTLGFSEGLIPLTFGASFVGMCSLRRFNIFQVSLSSIIYVFIFYKVTPLLSGMGGALGFSAFLSVGMVYLGSRCYQKAF